MALIQRPPRKCCASWWEWPPTKARPFSSLRISFRMWSRSPITSPSSIAVGRSSGGTSTTSRRITNVSASSARASRRWTSAAWTASRAFGVTDECYRFSSVATPMRSRRNCVSPWVGSWSAFRSRSRNSFWSTWGTTNALVEGLVGNPLARRMGPDDRNSLLRHAYHLNAECPVDDRRTGASGASHVSHRTGSHFRCNHACRIGNPHGLHARRRFRQGCRALHDLHAFTACDPATAVSRAHGNRDSRDRNLPGNPFYGALDPLAATDHESA